MPILPATGLRLFRIIRIWSDLPPMSQGLPQTRSVLGHGPKGFGRRSGALILRQDGLRLKAKEEGTMQHEASFRRLEAVQARPVAELLECPPQIALLLNGAAQAISFSAGELVFRQSGNCRGLYLLVSGQFVRRTERVESRLVLPPARVGDLVELAAVLGDGRHGYSLTAQSAGSVLMLPMEALNHAFQSFLPLKMRLLEELAREVSRAYCNLCLSHAVRHRRQTSAA